MADPDSAGRARSTRAHAAHLVVAVTDGRGRASRAAGLAAWLRRVAPLGARGEVGIALVSDARMRALNKQYRGKDYATDVLSFSARVGPDPHAPGARRSRRPQALPPDGGHQGDVAIATGVARRPAREAGHSYTDELKLLALHGLLHLIGYDHESRGDRGRMARIERRLRAVGGLRAGLIERSAPSRART